MNNMTILMSDVLKYSLIGAAAGVAAFILGFVICVLIKKKKQPRIKVDEEFINNIIAFLGGIKNLASTSVDNGRLKLEVSDLEVVDLNGLKTLSTAGVFVTGNIIKVLFKLDSNTIKKELDSRL